MRGVEHGVAGAVHQGCNSQSQFSQITRGVFNEDLLTGGSAKAERFAIHEEWRETSVERDFADRAAVINSELAIGVLHGREIESGVGERGDADIIEELRLRLLLLAASKEECDDRAEQKKRECGFSPHAGFLWCWCRIRPVMGIIPRGGEGVA